MTEPTPPIESGLAHGSTPQPEAPALGSEANPMAMGRVHLPRIAIKFCTQCRWMLRAAYVGPFRILVSTTYSSPLRNFVVSVVARGYFMLLCI